MTSNKAVTIKSYLTENLGPHTSQRKTVLKFSVSLISTSLKKIDQDFPDGLMVYDGIAWWSDSLLCILLMVWWSLMDFSWWSDGFWWYCLMVWWSLIYFSDGLMVSNGNVWWSDGFLLMVWRSDGYCLMAQWFSSDGLMVFFWWSDGLMVLAWWCRGGPTQGYFTNKVYSVGKSDSPRRASICRRPVRNFCRFCCHLWALWASLVWASVNAEFLVDLLCCVAGADPAERFFRGGDNLGGGGLTYPKQHFQVSPRI